MIGFEFINPEKEILSPLTNLAEGLSPLNLDKSLEFYNKRKEVDENGFHTKDFGLDGCVRSAESIFTGDVIASWKELSIQRREELLCRYADDAAKNFDVKNWNGLSFETLESGVLGYNNGDGTIHLTHEYIANNNVSPFSIIDTITHELRHQYQFESVCGLHPIREEIKVTWEKAEEEYTDCFPSVYDPFGYEYNALETDANYAGHTVIEDLYQDYANNGYDIKPKKEGLWT